MQWNLASIPWRSWNLALLGVESSRCTQRKARPSNLAGQYNGKLGLPCIYLLECNVHLDLALFILHKAWKCAIAFEMTFEVINYPCSIR